MSDELEYIFLVDVVGFEIGVRRDPELFQSPLQVRCKQNIPILHLVDIKRESFFHIRSRIQALIDS